MIQHTLSYSLDHSSFIHFPHIHFLPSITYNFAPAMDEAGGSSMLATHDSLQPPAARYVTTIINNDSDAAMYPFTHH